MSNTTKPTVFNGCAFCIDIPFKDARVNGETEQRASLRLVCMARNATKAGNVSA
jgi:AhpD family alkylhydroperoxidase